MKHLDVGHVARMTQLSDYEEIAEVLRSRNFVQGAYEVSGSEFMGGTLSALDGEEHLARRRVLAQLFSDEAMTEYRDAYVTPAMDLCLSEILAGPRDDNGYVPCDLVRVAERCLYRVAGAMTGIDGLDAREAADRFITLIQAIAGGLTLDWTRADPAEVAARAREAREAFNTEFFLPSQERRREALARLKSGAQEPALPRDALMLMIAHQGAAWPESGDALLREVTLLLTAATQSTASALVHFFLRLEKWLSAHPEDRALLESDPQFLRQAALESIRLTTGAPARIRKAIRDVTLWSGRSIKAGEKVALLLVASNTDEKHFGSDAECFNPHRVARDAPPWGHAFGGGAHTCLGRPLATGSRLVGKFDAEGVLALILRRLYRAGIQLDAARPPSHDTTTFYDVYTSVPVVLTNI